jgi:hypothetical protein
VNRSDLKEATAIVQSVTTDILATVHGNSGTAGARTRYSCGYLQANGGRLIAGDKVGFVLWLVAAFETAQVAGATYETMDLVRVNAAALSPSGLPAICVRNLSVRLALVELARILAATDFTSREQIDRYFDRINAAFDDAETLAADNLDNAAYRALVSLHAAVSNDLANRSRPLPRMVTISLPKRSPVLTIAQRLYADASRADELIGENSPIHPLFMGKTITALSS